MFPFGIASQGSFRRQIILTFVVGFFGLAVTFAAFMVVNERDNLHRNGREAATGLGQSLAVSARSWVLANDVVGMQEVVLAFGDYPDLRYVMIVSPTGRVLAHNDATKVGQFIADERSLALLKAQPEQQFMRDDDEVIEVALPIAVGERVVGWARVALGREEAQRGLNEFVGSITLFVLAVTVLFFVAALFMVNRLGRRIGSLVNVAKAVQAGDFAKRVTQVPGQEDEINRLAGSLNLMLDALSSNETQLRSVSRYTRSLIEASLDPLVTISPEGKITDVNLATEKATGLSREDLVGTDFSEYFTEPDKARAGYRQVFAQGSVTDYPLAIRHRDGHVTAVLYNASVYRNEEGVVQGMVAAARDISEQQRAVLLRAQLAAIVESSSDAIIGKTLDGVITSWNKGAEKIYGYSAEEVIGKPVTLLAPAAHHAEMHRLLETVRNGGTVSNHETERRRKDGTTIHVALTLSPIRDVSGKVSGISTIERDITERKRDEEALLRLNRELHAISSCNQVLMRADDEQALLGDICRIICDDAGYRMAWVGYPENDEGKTIRVVAYAGVEEGYLAQARITWADTERGCGPSGTAIRSENGACIHDFSSDPNAAPWRDDALQRGYRSSISMPLKDDNASTFGILTIYSAEPDAFTPEEIRLLEELAGDMAFGIVVLRARIERKRVEENLRQMNERYALSTRAARMGVWDWNLQKNELVWDDRMYELYGVRREDFVGAYEAWLQGIHPDDRATSDEISKQAQRGEREYDTEFRVVWPDGSIHYLKAYGQFVRDAEGKPLRMTGVNYDITGLKLAEEDIRKSEEKYRTLIQIIQAAVVVHGADTRIQTSNPLAQEILGLTEEQLLGITAIDPAWHFFREDGTAAAFDEYPVNRVLASRQPLRNLVLGVHRPNLEKDAWVLVNADPVFGNDGELVQIIVTFIDISERVRADMALRAERGLFVAGPSVVFKWRALEGWPVEYVSPNVTSQFGFAPEDLISGKVQYATLVHPDDIERVGHEVAAYSEQGVASFEQRYRLAGADGRYRWIEDFTTVIRGLDGSITHYLGYLLDITERKRVEDALLFVAQRGWQTGAENFFDALAQFLGEKLDMEYVLIDRIDEIPEMAETVALYAKGAIAPNMRYALKGTPCENVMGRQLCVFPNGVQQLFPEDTLLPEMGAESYVGIPLWDSTGRPIGLIAVMGNKPLPDDAPVTQLLQLVATRAAAELERRRAEEEVSKLNQELELRVANRTAQLETANKELESFSYSVSHDLRSPLRAIDGFSHILLEDYTDKLDDEGKRMLGIVRDNTTRMGHLIDDILKFSRSGRNEINAVEVDMAALAREVLDELQLGDMQVAKLRCEIGELPLARCDRAMMHQVFVNLISNAIKFSRTRETPTIEVGGSIQGDEIVYHVKDNGVGFDMQYADKLFGVFQRLHSMEEFEGTGIGLAIVKRIIARHGGRVWAEGKVNEGATIYFAIPAREKS